MRFAVRYLMPGAGAVQEATAEAASEPELRQRLLAEGRTPLSLRRLPEQAAPRAAARFDTGWWCRELRALLRAGMTVVEAIETIASGRDDGPRAGVHAALLDGLRQGQALSGAMRATGAFPEILVASVTASERTSNLVEVLDDYLRYSEMVERLRRQVTGAAIYPAIVVGLGAVISLFLLLFVVPRFSRMYGDGHAGVSTATQAVMWVSGTLRDRAHLVLVALALLALGAVAACRAGHVQRAAAWLLERCAPVQQRWDQFRLARLYQSMALMVQGGYTLDEALQVGQRLDPSSAMAARVGAARADMARGRAVADSLQAAGLTDTVTARLLRVGERGGHFDTVLRAVAERHAQAFATIVERATRVVEPLLLLLVALVVGGIVVMMYMPVFDIAGGLGQR